MSGSKWYDMETTLKRGTLPQFVGSVRVEVRFRSGRESNSNLTFSNGGNVLTELWTKRREELIHCSILAFTTREKWA